MLICAQELYLIKGEVMSIVINCTICKVQRISRRRIVVKYCVDNETYTYEFTCRKCLVHAFRNCTKEEADSLVVSGVQMVLWRLPREVVERPPIHFPAFTELDAEALAHILENTDDQTLLKMFGASNQGEIS